MPEQHFAFGPFPLDAARGALMRDANPIRIGHRALAVLQALLRADGQVSTKEELLRAAWPKQVVEESNLSVQIAALRKLLATATDETWIETVVRVGYRFAGPLRVYDSDVHSRPWDEPLGPGCRASIAVLPFDNLSGDAGQDYFADGVSEDIVAALARFRWLFVVARNTSFALKRKGLNARDIAEMLGVRYALAGSVRRSPQRIRISAELLEVHSALQLWSERYDLPDGELFAVQDQIAERVVGAIEPELLSATAARRPRSSAGLR